MREFNVFTNENPDLRHQMSASYEPLQSYQLAHDAERDIYGAIKNTAEKKEQGNKHHMKLLKLMQNTPDDVPMLTPPSTNEDVEILGIYARLPDRTEKQSPSMTSIDKKTRTDLTDINNYELFIRLTSHIGLLKYHSPIAIKIRFLNDALMCFKPET